MRTVPPTRRREPAVNLPPLLLGSVVALLAVHAARAILSPVTDLELLLALAFVPASWSVALGFADPGEILRAAAGADAEEEIRAMRIALARYLTADATFRPWTALSYAALHGSWLHVGLNSVWLAAFGAPVVRRAGTGRALVLFAAAALGGAAAQWLSGPLSVQPMIGASAIVSGVMAAAATFIFAGSAGSERGGWAFLRNRNALGFLGLWLAINLVFGVVAEPLGITEGAIAWQAHIGGLAVGLLLFPLLDPSRPRGPGRPFGA